MSDKSQMDQAEKSLQDVEIALSRTEQFIEKNQKTIITVALVILGVVALVWAYNSLYREPLKKEAQASIFNAQYYFEVDSFNLALNGDGMNDGFLAVIDKYGSTPAGELAKYYAGICQLNLGQFAEAKKNFDSFSSDDDALNTMAKGLIGDAESELGNTEAAIAAYKKAANADNAIASPIFLKKLGDAYRAAGKKAEAKAAYQTIKDKYSRSNVARDIEKSIATVD
ncbi:MAG: tetratricopeptide repeat protein [Bacteroidales bacterium]|nr:tetratricopeptide repeat protein [Bacteroidales bacterium]